MIPKDKIINHQMTPLRAYVAIAFSSLCLSAAAAQPPRGCISENAGVSAELEREAKLAFRQQRYAAAYGRYMRLADMGNITAAEIALLMYRQGPHLFGTNWSATDQQLACWRTLIINNLRHSTLRATEDNR
jgi:hypothetical protein